MLHQPFILAAILSAIVGAGLFLAAIAARINGPRRGLDDSHLKELQKAISEERRKMDQSTDAWLHSEAARALIGGPVRGLRISGNRFTPSLGPHPGGTFDFGTHSVIAEPDWRKAIADGFREYTRMIARG